MFGDHAVEGQGGLGADIGTLDEAIGDGKRVRLDLAKRRRQGIETLSQLQKLSRSGPTRQLPLQIGRLDVTGQQQTRLKNRVICHDFN